MLNKATLKIIDSIKCTIIPPTIGPTTVRCGTHNTKYNCNVGDKIISLSNNGFEEDYYFDVIRYKLLWIRNDSIVKRLEVNSENITLEIEQNALKGDELFLYDIVGKYHFIKDTVNLNNIRIIAKGIKK